MHTASVRTQPCESNLATITQRMNRWESSLDRAPDFMKLTEEQKLHRKALADSGQYVELPNGKLRLNRFGSKYEAILYTNFRAKYGETLLRRGCPDFIIKLPNKKPFFVEVKGPTDHFTKYQRTFGDLLRELGVDVFTSHSGEIPPEIEQLLAT